MTERLMSPEQAIRIVLRRRLGHRGASIEGKMMDGLATIQGGSVDPWPDRLLEAQLYTARLTDTQWAIFGALWFGSLGSIRGEKVVARGEDSQSAIVIDALYTKAPSVRDIAEHMGVSAHEVQQQMRAAVDLVWQAIIDAM